MAQPAGLETYILASALFSKRVHAGEIDDLVQEVSSDTGHR